MVPQDAGFGASGRPDPLLHDIQLHAVGDAAGGEQSVAGFQPHVSTQQLRQRLGKGAPGGHKLGVWRTGRGEGAVVAGLEGWIRTISFRMGPGEVSVPTGTPLSVLAQS